ncbi:MAG: DNA recombination protein RmuC [Candidatus Thermoplasmatota archaeon]|nr:DNA recombination protein RmuC [Candidatus Thermoplasmatota archaeon]
MSDTILIVSLVIITTIGLAGLLLYVLGLIKRITEETVTLRQETIELRAQAQQQTQVLGALDVGIKPEEITAAIAQSGDALKGAMTRSLTEIKLKEDIANITQASKLIQSEVGDINKIFVDKQEAAGWAEIELKERLKDTFRDVHTGKKIAKLGGVIPDAHLILAGGKILCIDSKFPVKSFKATIPVSEGGDGEEDGRRRVGSRRDFIDAITKHYAKVEKDYVRPDLGTTEVAYMYVASERIYHHMVNPENAEECEIVREGANKGVVLCSPSTLIANMHLIRIAEQAMGIAEKSDEILKGHIRLRQELDTLASSWSTLSGQIGNSYNNRSKIQDGIDSIERTLNSLENLNLEDSE